MQREFITQQTAMAVMHGVFDGIALGLPWYRVLKAFKAV